MILKLQFREDLDHLLGSRRVIPRMRSTNTKGGSILRLLDFSSITWAQISEAEYLTRFAGAALR